ncbi:ATP-dependent RNA helicase [Polyrhizophydium stewartii]|uniref:ATP-dependent RNA helicase n=1 Tax=Polyrhizophydium stewartii TaxID=2732419 RepID=A0ABR4NH51_9FUNG|nr:ATP-dependent RNA helicase [Polyrhizophydium stewartii]
MGRKSKKAAAAATPAPTAAQDIGALATALGGKTVSMGPGKVRWRPSRISPRAAARAEDAFFLSLEEIDDTGDFTAEDLAADADADTDAGSDGDGTGPRARKKSAASGSHGGVTVGGGDGGDIEDVFGDIDMSTFVHIDEFVEPEPEPPGKKGGAVQPAKRLKRISAEESTPIPRTYADADANEDDEVHDPAQEEDAADADGHEAEAGGSQGELVVDPEILATKVPASSPWLALGLHARIAQTLHWLKFAEPTDIQTQTLSQALIHHRDVIGAAQTGSGKTLAFGLPILHHVAGALDSQKDLGCAGLIITPTRELAVQITDHLKKAGAAVTRKIVAVVGGMSAQKQKRQLATKPHIVDPELQKSIQRVKFLVIDEADRMLEAGHFKDLDEILARISVNVLPADEAAKIKRRTLVFSATMLEDDGIKQRVTAAKKKNKGFGNSIFGKLLEKVNFRDPHPVYINLTTKSVMAKGLLEAKIDCLKTEKDHMLYYVLCRYPGKTIVFVNSIDAIRRLVPILTLLKVQVVGLHAEMQQRQRLKNLDRFRATPNAVLVASDVASRGLDIPKVDHVVHYQLPRSADIYVHRSGRTARANNEGISVALCSPDELTMYKKVCHILGKADGMPDFPVDLSVLTAIKERLALAREVDLLQHREKKAASERDWFRKAAEEADIALSDDEEDGDEGSGSKLAALSAKDVQKMHRMRRELAALLARPLIPKGVSTKYLTSNTVDSLVDVLMASRDRIMPAFQSTSAIDDLRGKLPRNEDAGGAAADAASAAAPKQPKATKQQKQQRRKQMKQQAKDDARGQKRKQRPE